MLQRIVVLIIVIVGLAVNAGCEKSAKPPQTSLPKDWQRKEASFFTFYLPPAMTQKEVKGNDSEFLLFESESMKLEIETGPYSDDLDSRRDKPGYQEMFTEVDGRKAKLCLFTTSDTKSVDNNLLFAVALYFSDIGKKNNKLTLLVKYNLPSEQSVAEKIFYSIKFKHQGTMSSVR